MTVERESEVEAEPMFSLKWLSSTRFILIFNFPSIVGSAANPDPYNCQLKVKQAGFLCLLKRDSAAIALTSAGGGDSAGSGTVTQTQDHEQDNPVQEYQHGQAQNYQQLAAPPSPLPSPAPARVLQEDRPRPNWINCEPNSLRGAARSLPPDEFAQLLDRAIQVALRYQSVSLGFTD